MAQRGGSGCRGVSGCNLPQLCTAAPLCVRATRMPWQTLRDARGVSTGVCGVSGHPIAHVLHCPRSSPVCNPGCWRRWAHPTAPTPHHRCPAPALGPTGGHVSRDTRGTLPAPGLRPHPVQTTPTAGTTCTPQTPTHRGVGSTHHSPLAHQGVGRRWEPGSGGAEGAAVRRGLRGGSGAHRDVRRAAALTFTSPLSPRQPPHVSH